MKCEYCLEHNKNKIITEVLTRHPYTGDGYNIWLDTSREYISKEKFFICSNCGKENRWVVECGKYYNKVENGKKYNSINKDLFLLIILYFISMIGIIYVMMQMEGGI